MLVIDDNQFIRSPAMAMLRAFGVGTIIDLAGAAEAFRIMRHRGFDLIIANYNMNPPNGIEFVKLVRTASDSRCRKAPIIMMTGHTEYEVITAARDVHTTGMLLKPIAAKTLIHRIIYVFDHPRKWVEDPIYTGPDRRRQFLDWQGGVRRGRAKPSAPRPESLEGMEIDQGWGLTAEEVQQLIGLSSTD